MLKHFAGLRISISLIVLLLTGLVFGLGMAQAGSCLPASDPLAWWGFDGDYQDLSGNGHNAVVSRRIDFDEGICLMGAKFTGAPNHLATDDHRVLQLTGSFSIMAWVKPSALTDRARIFSQESGDRFILLGLEQGVPYAGLGNGGYFRYTPKPGGRDCDHEDTNALSLNEWHLLIFSYNDQNKIMRLYVDGQQRGDGFALPRRFKLPSMKNVQISIGAEKRGRSDFYQGLMDNLAVFGRVVTDDEIASVYETAGLPGCRWASQVTDVWQGPTADGADVPAFLSDPAGLLGEVTGDGDYYALGYGGYAVLEIDQPLDPSGGRVTVYTPSNGRHQSKDAADVFAWNGGSWVLLGRTENQGGSQADQFEWSGFTTNRFKIVDQSEASGQGSSSRRGSSRNGFCLDGIKACGYETDAPLISITFETDRDTVSEGETAILSWTVTNAEQISIDQGLGEAAPAPYGSMPVTPQETTVYTLTATSAAFGSATASVTVNYQSNAPAAYWPMDSTAQDAAGDCHGTLKNGAGFTTGLFGQALELDGDEQHIIVNDAPALRLSGSFSISAWVRPEGFDNCAKIISKRRGNDFWFLGLHNGVPYGALGSGSCNGSHSGHQHGGPNCDQHDGGGHDCNNNDGSHHNNNGQNAGHGSNQGGNGGPKGHSQSQSRPQSKSGDNHNQPDAAKCDQNGHGQNGNGHNGHGHCGHFTPWPNGADCGRDALVPGQWAHLVLVYDREAQVMWLYVNNEQRGPYALDDDFQVPALEGVKVSIGADFQGSTCFFEGAIDDLALYHRALSADEVADLYASADLPTCSWGYQVVEFAQGVTKGGEPVSEVRSDPSTVLGPVACRAEEGTFFSLGFGGFIVIKTEDAYTDGTITIFEASRRHKNRHREQNQSGKKHHHSNQEHGYPLETADVYGWNGSDWVLLGSVDNRKDQGAQPSPLDFSGFSFQQFKIVDTTDPNHWGPDGDGFDLDGIKVCGTVQGQVYPPTVDISAEPPAIPEGGVSTLSWTSAYADQVEIDQGIGQVSAGGALAVTPAVSTLYTITATGPGGTAQDTVTVEVISKPVISLTADPVEIERGHFSTLTWTSSGADTVVIEPDVGSVDLSGVYSVTPETTTVYTASAIGPGGRSTASATVTVIQPKPSVTFSVEPSTIDEGDNAVLTWSIENGETATIDQGIGDIDQAGARTVSPTHNTTYTLTAEGPGGTTVVQLLLKVQPLPTVSLNVSPDTIVQGESATLSWTSTDAESAEITPDLGSVDVSGTAQVSPDADTTYNITITGPTGRTATAQAVLTVLPLVQVTFSAEPMVIAAGESAELSWQTENVTSVTIEPDIGSVDLSGTMSVSPTETTTYTIQGVGPGQSVSESVTITVLPKPTAELSAEPERIIKGGSTTLTWTTSNAHTITIDQGVGTVDATGSITVSPEEDTTYTLTATGDGGTVTSETQVTVVALPTAELTVNPTEITAGETAVLEWTTTNADTITLEPDVGSVEPSGSLTVTPDQTTTYTLTAQGEGGTATAQVTLNVSIPAPAASITATPDMIGEEGYSILNWETTHAETVTIEPEIGVVETSGSMMVYPTETTTYILTATGLGGTTSAQVTITVGDLPIPTITVYAEPETIREGGAAMLTWETTYADMVSIDHGIGAVDPNGSIYVYPMETTTYNITASNSSGSTTGQVTVNVLWPPYTWITAYPRDILAGQSSTLDWVTANADVVTIEPGIGPVDPYGPIPVTPTETTTYTISATNSIGSSSDQVTITVYQKLTASFSVNTDAIILGDSAILTWNTSNADSVTIDQGIGGVDFSGSITISPTENTTYTMRASNPVETITAEVSVTVMSASISAEPEIIPLGGSSTLAWNTANAETVTIEPGIGSVDPNGSITITPVTTTTYTLNVAGDAGLISKQVTVSVYPKPTVTFSADPEMIHSGETSTLTWETNHAESVMIYRNIGPVGLNGNTTVSPDQTTTYTLIAAGPFESTMASVVITLADPDLEPKDMDLSGATIDSQTLGVTGTAVVGIGNNGIDAPEVGYRVTLFEDSNGDENFTESLDNVLGQGDVLAGPVGGGIVNLSIPLKGRMTFQNNRIFAFVDSRGDIFESSESNNLINNMTNCECTRPPGPFEPVLEWAWTGSEVAPYSNHVWCTPVVANLNDDNGDGLIDEKDIPDIIFISWDGETDWGIVDDGTLRAVSGDGRGEVFSVAIDETNPLFDPAVGDIDGDGLPEILTKDEDDHLMAFENDGTLKWKNDAIIYWGSHITLADLDADGIPEIIVGGHVINNDGTTRWIAPIYDRSDACVANLDLWGDPEVIMGGGAYRSNGIAYWPPVSNHIQSGAPAVANFDDDPYPEVVYAGNNNFDGAGRYLYLFEHDGTLKWKYPIWPLALGTPTIADFDGDGAPEIGIGGSEYYYMLETDGSLKWTATINDNSGNNGSSAFDFDGDGSAEVIYHDELTLWIFNGTDGAVLFETPNSSGTYREIPVIADVDNDHSAEIVVVSNLNLNDTAPGIRVFGGLNNTWVNSRKIWNQYSYHITNVNDDATIPRVELNNWEVYNNYRQNQMLNPKGCQDLSVSFLRADSADYPDSIELKARVGNGGAWHIKAGVKVSFYHGQPSSGGILLVTLDTDYLDSGAFQDLSFTWSSPPEGYQDIYVRVDDDGSGQGIINESDEDNNTSYTIIKVGNTAPEAEAGPDQTVSRGQFVTLDGSGSTDPDGDPLAYMWTLKIQPGSSSAVLSDPLAPSTTFFADVPGIYTVELVVFDGTDLSPTDTVTINVLESLPPTVTISAVPQMINKGESAVLTWETNHAQTAEIDQGIGTVDLNGSITVYPSETTAYTISAVGLGGATEARVTISVLLQPEIDFSANPSSIVEGEASTLIWDTVYADSIEIDQNIGHVDPSGSIEVTPGETTIYTITATGPGGSCTASVTVTVSHQPIISFTADYEMIKIGGSTTLRWSSTRADTCEIDQGIGSVDLNGSIIVSPLHTTEYTITAIGSSGISTASVTVTVHNPFSLEIIKPLEGDVISGPYVMVTGAITNSDGNETSVIVNGVLALVHGNQFVANHVPLFNGENTITATATDSEGGWLTTSIVVEADTDGPYILLEADPEAGTAPLENNLTIDGNVNISDTTLSCECPFPVEFQEQLLEKFHILFNDPGLYIFRADVVDDRGGVHSDEVAVRIMDFTETDTLLKQIWEGLKTALIAGDIETALSYHQEFSRAGYAEIYYALENQLPDIAQAMQPIYPVYIDADLAKYRLPRDEDVLGQVYNITYYLYFTRDLNGLWRVDRY